MKGKLADCHVTIIGAGPYGLSSAAHLRASGVEARVFGEPMSFWENQMPAGMFLRSNAGASVIADPGDKLTLKAYCDENGNHLPYPVPLERFLGYGHWYQRQAVPDVDRRQVASIGLDPRGFQVVLVDGEQLFSRRVVVAAGIGTFASRPPEFDGVPVELASHSSQQSDLRKFKGRRVVVIGAGQSALESAALFKEAGIEVEVIARQRSLNWVGLHPKLHHLGVISWMLYSDRDVGPAGLSRLVAMPHLFRKFPRGFQDRTSYRAIRPAGAGWLQSRIKGVPITLGRRVVSATATGSQLHLKLDDGTDRLVDHALLATGYRVDVRRHEFLSPEIMQRLDTVNGYPVLKVGMECSIPGLHFVGKPAAWSFGPLLGFVSGTEFASNELVRSITGNKGTTAR
jgi:hypothetical protein